MGLMDGINIAILNIQLTCQYVCLICYVDKLECKLLKNNESWQEFTFDLGNMACESGEVLMQAKLHYHQHGALNAQKDNLIIMPTYYGGEGVSNRAWVDDPLSPLHNKDYCIVIPCLFGAGESSSPSNTEGEQHGAHFPAMSYLDNVKAQHKLIATQFEGATIRLVMGWSMGGMQSLQWATHYPDKVQSALAICATAKCYPHNAVFLEGVAACLLADQAFNKGNYSTPPINGLTAFAKVYASWAYSQAFYRNGLYKQLGFESVDDVINYWIDDHLNQDANNLLTQLRTWQTGDVYKYKHDINSNENVEKLHCPTILMPSSSDLYFTETDARADAEQLGADCIPLQSDFGHVAGGPGRLPDETQAIYQAIATLLAKTENEC